MGDGDVMHHRVEGLHLERYGLSDRKANQRDDKQNDDREDEENDKRALIGFGQ